MKEILTKARDRVKDPEHWCQGTYALTKDGLDANPTEDRADRFCAIGALLRANDKSENYIKAELALRHAASKLFSKGPTSVNDQLGHEAVVAMFDEAINGSV